MSILSKLFMAVFYLCLAVIGIWLIYMFSMAIANTICDCIRTGPQDILDWIKKEGA